MGAAITSLYTCCRCIYALMEFCLLLLCPFAPLFFFSCLSWLPVEALCAGLGANGKHGLAEAEGRELVLFGGKVGSATVPLQYSQSSTC